MTVTCAGPGRYILHGYRGGATLVASRFQRKRVRIVTRKDHPMSNRHLRSAALAFVLLLIPAAALAQTELVVTVTTANSCRVATFSVNVEGGAGPYTLDWAFGDGETAQEADVVGFPHETSHTYAAQGDYLWSVLVTDLDGLAGSAEGRFCLGGAG